METLRRKAPELALEALSVVFAVLVALGVDEWRENRQNQERADRALVAITGEVRSNRAELEENLANNVALLGTINEAARADSLPPGLNISYEYSLLATSAWETAQVAQATQFIPLERVQSLARLYGLQRLFEESQGEVMDFILGIAEVAEETPERIPRLMRGRLNNAVGMQQLLITAYDSTLAALGRDPGEAEPDTVGSIPGDTAAPSGG